MAASAHDVQINVLMNLANLEAGAARIQAIMDETAAGVAEANRVAESSYAGMAEGADTAATAMEAPAETAAETAASITASNEEAAASYAAIGEAAAMSGVQVVGLSNKMATTGSTAREIGESGGSSLREIGEAAAVSSAPILALNSRMGQTRTAAEETGSVGSSSIRQVGTAAIMSSGNVSSLGTRLSQAGDRAEELGATGGSSIQRIGAMANLAGIDVTTLGGRYQEVGDAAKETEGTAEEMGSAGESAMSRIVAGGNGVVNNIGEINSGIGGLIAAYGALTIASTAYTGAVQAQSNQAFLARKFGTVTGNKEQQAIMNTVASLPMDDTYSNQLMTQMVSRSGIIPSQSTLTQWGSTIADYMAGQTMAGHNPATTERDLQNYVLTGNTMDMQKASILKDQLKTLENQSTVQDRMNALNKALVKDGYAGISTMDTLSNKETIMVGEFQKAATGLGMMVIPAATQFVDLMLGADTATDGWSTKLIIISGLILGIVGSLGSIAGPIKAGYDVISAFGGGIKKAIQYMWDLVTATDAEAASQERVAVSQSTSAELGPIESSGTTVLPLNTGEEEKAGEEAEGAAAKMRTLEAGENAVAASSGGMIGAIRAIGSALLSFATNPIGLAIIGLTALAGALVLAGEKYGWFKSGVEQANEALSSMKSNVNSAKQAQASAQAEVTKWTAAVNNAQPGTKAYTDAVNHLKSAKEELKTATSNATYAEQSYSKAEATTTKLTQGLEQAEAQLAADTIKYRVATGELTPAQGKQLAAGANDAASQLSAGQQKILSQTQEIQKQDSEIKQSLSNPPKNTPQAGKSASVNEQLLTGKQPSLWSTLTSWNPLSLNNPSYTGWGIPWISNLPHLNFQPSFHSLDGIESFGNGLGGLSSWLGNGLNTVAGAPSSLLNWLLPKPASAADTSSKPGATLPKGSTSLQSVSLGGGGIHWPSSQDILKFLHLDGFHLPQFKLPSMQDVLNALHLNNFHLPQLKLPSIGQIGGWIQDNLHWPNLQIPSLGQIQGWIQSHLHWPQLQIPTLGQIGQWIQNHIPHITWQIPSFNDILGLIKQAIGSFHWPTGPGGIVTGIIRRGENELAQLEAKAAAKAAPTINAVTKAGSSIQSTANSGINYLGGAAHNTINYLGHLLGPAGPASSKPIDMVKSIIGSLPYIGYEGSRNSIEETLAKGGNCFDLTVAGMWLASQAGLDSQMQWTTWNGGSHVNFKAAGETIDPSHYIINGNWGDPPAGPATTSGTVYHEGDVYMPLVIQGDVYGSDDFETKVGSMIDTKFRPIVRSMKRRRA